MKPDNWNELPLEEKKKMVSQLLIGSRGQYLLSQALYYAIQELKKAKYPEQSNIEDMEMMREVAYTLFLDPVDIDELLKKMERR